MEHTAAVEVVQKTRVVVKQAFVAVDAVGASVAEDVGASVAEDVGASVAEDVVGASVAGFVAAFVAGVVAAFVAEFAEVLVEAVEFLVQLVVWVHVADLFVFYPAGYVVVGHLVVLAEAEHL